VRELLLIRHGATAWNESGRIQGRRDVALSAAGRAALAGRTVPAPWHAGQWYASPLRRALDSASLLGAPDVRPQAALIEMDWGEWEGQTLAALRARLGEPMRANEALGLDFRPGGGESPREVRERLRAWLATLPPQGPALVAVSHKGVIRAALSLACDWDMRADFRPRLDWSCAHALRVDAHGGLSVARLNVALLARGA
jgi:probable phosphoglycerate mutase